MRIRYGIPKKNYLSCEEGLRVEVLVICKSMCFLADGNAGERISFVARVKRWERGVPDVVKYIVGNRRYGAVAMVSWSLSIVFVVCLLMTLSAQAAQQLDAGQASMLVTQARKLLDEGRLDDALVVLRRPELVLDARANYWRGAILKKQGDLDQAAAALRESVRLLPGLIEGRLLLAEVYKSQGKLKESIEQYEFSERLLVNSPVLASVRNELVGLYRDIARQMKKRLQEQPDLANQAIDLAKRMFRKELFREAEQLLETVIVKTKENAQAHYWLGQVYLRRGRKNDGVSSLEQSVDLAPENMVLKIELAKVYEELGRFDRAEGIYRKVFSGQQVTPAQRALAERRLRVVEARRLALAGDDNQALENYQRLLQEMPNDTRLLELTAKTLEKLARRSEADAIYLRLRQLLPTDAELRLRLAEVYRLRGDALQMQSAFAEAMRLATDDDVRRRALDGLGLKRGDNLILQGEYEKAEQVISNLATLVPENPDVMMRVARISLAQKRYRLAQKTLKHILEIAPDRADAQLNIGQAYQALERYDDAINALEKVLRMDAGEAVTKSALTLLKPLYEKQASVLLASLDRSEAISEDIQKRALNLARRLFGRGQFTDAESILTSLLTKVPGDAQANYWLGKLELQTKRPEAGLAHLARSVVLAPENGRLRMELGKVHEAAGHWQEAISEYSRVAESDGNEKIRRAARKRLGIAQGQLLIAENKKEEALATYDSLLVEFPGDGQLLGLQGAVLQDLGRIAEAEAVFDKLLASSPKNIRIRLRVASLYEKEKRFEKAAEVYNQLIKIQPKNPRLYYELGSLYLRMERFNDAYQKYQKAISLSPPGSKLLAQSSASLDLVKKNMIDRGRKHLDAEELDEAEALFQAALELDPDQARAHYWLSQLYKKRESFSDEVAELERSLALRPDNSPLIPVLAQAYLNAGLPRKAANVLLPLIKQSPFDFESRLILATSYEKLGEKQLEDNQLEWILQHDAEEAIRDKTLDRLGLKDALDSMNNGDQESARRVLTKLLAMIPQDPVINKYMAESLLKEGDAESALVFLQTAMSSTPRDPVLHQQLASVYERLERFDDSLGEYRLLASMTLSGNDKKRARQGLKRLLNRRAKTLLNELNLGGLSAKEKASLLEETEKMIDDEVFSAAKMIAEAIIDAQPDQLWGYELLAKVYQQSSKPDDAILILKKALSLHPGDPDLLLKLAQAFRLAGKPALALSSYRELLFSQPNSAVAPLEMAEIFHEQGDDEAMRSSLILALRQGDDPELKKRALNELGLQEGLDALAGNDIERAKTIFKSLFLLAPDEPAVLALQAGITRQQGDLAAAAELLRRVLTANEQREDIRLQLAEILVEDGMSEQAVPELEKVALLGPGNKYARKAADMLKKLAIRESRSILKAVKEADVIDGVLLKRALNIGRRLYYRRLLNAAEAIFNALLAKQVTDEQAYFWLGKILIDKNKLSEGIAKLKKSIELAPKNVRLRMTLAKTYEGAGRWHEAEAVYRSVIQISTKKNEEKLAKKRLQIVRGQLLAKQGQQRQALVVYEKVLKEYPSDVQVMGLKGVLLLSLGQLSAADETFARLVELAPENDRVRLRLAGIYRQQGRQKDAEEQLFVILKRHSSGPLTIQALRMLGLAKAIELRKRKDWEKLEILLRQMLTKVPGNIVLLKSLADVYQKQGRLPEFQRTLQSLLKIKADDAGSLWGLAQLYLSTGREQKAIPLLERLLEKERKSARGQKALQIVSDYYRRQVNNYRKNKEYTKAAVVLEKFVRDNADNIQARLQLGLYYYYGQEMDKAIDVFEEVIRMSPREAPAYRQLALIYSRQNKPRKEIENYAYFISLLDDEQKAEKAATDLLLSLVRALLEEGRQVAAIRVLEQMRDRGVRDIRIYSLLGFIQTQQGERELAIEAYRQGIAVDGSNLRLRINLALLYEQTSADPAALAQYRAILKQGKPGNRYVERARQRKKFVETRLRRFTSNLAYSVRGGQSVIEEQDVSNTGAINTSFSSSLNYSLTSSFKPTEKSNVSVSASVAHSPNHSGQNDSIAPSISVNGNLNLGSGFFNSRVSYRETFGLLLDTFAGYGVNGSIGGGLRFANPIDSILGIFSNSDDTMPEAVLWTETPAKEETFRLASVSEDIVINIDVEELRQEMVKQVADVDRFVSAIVRSHQALQQGNPQMVIDELLPLQVRLPNNPEINLLLGQAYQNLGQDDLALGNYWQVLDKYHDNPQARYFYGQVLLSQGYPVEAAGWFVGVLDSAQANSLLKDQARLHLMAIHQANIARLMSRKQGQVDVKKALVEIDFLEKYAPPAVVVKAIDDLLQVFEDAPGLLLRKGRSMLRLQRPDRAVSSLERADDIRENDLEIEAMLAEAYIQMGRLDEALEISGKMYTQTTDPELKYRLYLHSPVFNDITDYDAADNDDLPDIAKRLQSLSVIQKSDFAIFERQLKAADAAFLDGAAALARTVYQSLLDLEPDNYFLKLRIAESLLAEGLSTEGQAILKRLSADKESAWAYYRSLSLLGFFQAIEDLVDDDYKDALTRLMDIRQLIADDDLVLLNMGIAERRLGADLKAKVFFETVIESEPDNLTARWLFGLFYSDKKQLNRGMDQLENVIADGRGTYAASESARRLQLLEDKRFRALIGDVDQKSDATTKVFSMTLGYNNFTPIRISLGETQAYSLNSSLRLPSTAWGTTSLSYGLTKTLNEDPLGTDYANTAQQFAISYSRSIPDFTKLFYFFDGRTIPDIAKLSGSLSVSRRIADYDNFDTNARVDLGMLAKRQIIQDSFSVNLNYQLHPALTLSAAYSQSSSRSNLPVGLVYRPDDIPIAFQSLGLGDLSSKSLSLSLRFRF